MKVVVAFDKFRGTLSAAGACHIAAASFSGRGAQVVEKPLADGGEGTAESMLAANGGAWIPLDVTGPLPGMRVRAGFAWFPVTKTALIEMATASGLALLKPEQRNPLAATTRGTGELIDAAIRHGASSILLAIGGSATNDGGIGAATALGWRFLDAQDNELPPVGASLTKVAQIVPPPPRQFPPVDVLCDVTNPLFGPQGAAAVFGPQKGATPAMVAELDAGLRNLAGVIARSLGRNVDALPGGGAAGGLGAGAVAFMSARLVSGITSIMQAYRLEDAIRNADWVITGEGAIDRQSLMGKVLSGVLNLARRHGVRVAVIAGRIDLSTDELRAAGVAHALALVDGSTSAYEAMTNARAIFTDRANLLAAMLAPGKAGGLN